MLGTQGRDWEEIKLLAVICFQRSQVNAVISIMEVDMSKLYFLICSTEQ